METWVYIIAVLALAAATIAYVMATPGMKEAVTLRPHGHHAGAPAPHVETAEPRHQLDGAPAAAAVPAVAQTVAETSGPVADAADEPEIAFEQIASDQVDAEIVLDEPDVPQPDLAPVAAEPLGADASNDLGQVEHMNREDERAAAEDAALASPVAAVFGEAPEQVWDGPFGPGSADAADDGSGPRGWTVKAARSARVYLTADLPVFEQARANVWFVNEQRAIDAGFTKWTPPAS